MSKSGDVRPSLLLKNARVVLLREVLEDASVLIEGERIAGIFASGEDEPSRADSVRDLDGLTLLPGFIDIHIHGAMGVDTTEAGADELHTVARFLARHGTTAWLPTLVPAPDENYKQAARAVEELMKTEATREPAARALGLHYEGPFVNEAQCGALRPHYFRKFTDANTLVALAPVNHPEARHLMTIAPEIEGGIELVGELTQRGWITSIGHTRADVETLDRAHAAGAHHLTHFMNAMQPMKAREPGPVGWGLMRDDVTCDLIADGVHVDSLMLRLVLRCKTAERTVLISDAVAPAGLGDGTYKMWDEKITVKNGRTGNERGNIAGSVGMMRDCARTIAALGYGLPDVARMASLNPAHLLGLEKDYGSIETGKRADLAALNENWQVQLTLIGGRVAFDAAGHRVAKSQSAIE